MGFKGSLGGRRRLSHLLLCLATGLVGALARLRAALIQNLDLSLKGFQRIVGDQLIEIRHRHRRWLIGRRRFSRDNRAWPSGNRDTDAALRTRAGLSAGSGRLLYSGPVTSVY